MSDPTPSPRSVLVTGGAGFIGSAVAARLARGGARVVVVDDLSSGRAERVPAGVGFRRADVAGPGVLEHLLVDDGPFDAVLHLAARVGVRTVLADPDGCRDENLAGVHELARAIAALEPRRRPRVFAASTSEVYRERPEPLVETDALRPVDAAGRWAYAGSKLAGERALDRASALWPADRGPVHLRFFNVVGPGQDPVSGMVLPTFVEQALAGEPITVHGDGRQVRTLAHVDDVALDLVTLLAAGRAPAGPLNLGGTAKTTVLALAERVALLSGRSTSIVHVDPKRAVSDRFEEVRHREPCLDRAHGLGLARRSRTLDEIVEDTLRRHVCRGGAGRAGDRACVSLAS